MADDPWGDIIPIRVSNEPPALAAVSKIERAQRGKRSRANRGPDNPAQTRTAEPAEPPSKVSESLKRRKRPINSPELEAMVDTLLRINYTKSKNLNARSQDVKNATIAFAVLVDKKQVIRGKPSQVIGFAEAEATRPGLLEMAKLIADGGAA